MSQVAEEIFAPLNDNLSEVEIRQVMKTVQQYYETQLLPARKTQVRGDVLAVHDLLSKCVSTGKELLKIAMIQNMVSLQGDLYTMLGDLAVIDIEEIKGHASIKLVVSYFQKALEKLSQNPEKKVECGILKMKIKAFSDAL